MTLSRGKIAATGVVRHSITLPHPVAEMARNRCGGAEFLSVYIAQTVEKLAAAKDLAPEAWAAALASGPDLQDEIVPGRTTRHSISLPLSVSMRLETDNVSAAVTACLLEYWRGSEFARGRVAVGYSAGELSAVASTLRYLLAQPQSRRLLVLALPALVEAGLSLGLAAELSPAAGRALTRRLHSADIMERLMLVDLAETASAVLREEKA